MITQSKTESVAPNETWAGIDDKFLNSQRSGGGFVGVLIYPLIAASALLFAVYELATLVKP